MGLIVTPFTNISSVGLIVTPFTNMAAKHNKFKIYDI